YDIRLIVLHAEDRKTHYSHPDSYPSLFVTLSPTRRSSDLSPWHFPAAATSSRSRGPPTCRTGYSARSIGRPSIIAVLSSQSWQRKCWRDCSASSAPSSR